MLKLKELTSLKMHRQLLTAILTSLVMCISQVGFADDLQTSQKELEKIQSELKSLQASLAKAQKETTAQRKALREVETEIGRLQKSLASLTKTIADQKQLQQQLEAQKQRLTAQLSLKSEEINSILRLAYKQNNQPLIKLLLSGERPEDLSRHLYYFSVLTGNQQSQVEVWLDEKQRLSATIQAEALVIVDLEAQEAELLSQQAELNRQKNRRAQVVANLVAESQNTASEIDRKEQEREKMAELIEDIQKKLDSMSLEFPGAVAISELQGKLNWPVQGKLSNQYGRTIDNSRLRWQGWLITAPEGKEVIAVHGGRIVFADFFKSNGLLIIIDHGNGIWTLYGRNRALLRDVGSWVEPGDVIAEVGQSGGHNQSGLYFEVRKNGEPQNPANWLKKGR
jgi:septal ring factor EnvC (AmiA/AmiB activator)